MSVKIIPPFKVVLSKAAGNDIEAYETCIRKLRQITLGKEDGFPRLQAMRLLFASDFGDKELDFKIILENEQEPSDIRYFAALYLGKINSPAALAILHSNCKIKDERVLIGVVKALGRIGNKKTLEIIVNTKTNARGILEAQTNFACALIAHRHGLPENEIPVPADSQMLILPATGVNTFQIMPAKKEEIVSCLRDVKKDMYGVEIDESRAYTILCQRRTWMLLLNREFSNDGAVKKLAASKAFLGLIARKSEETHDYSIARLLLASPVKGFERINIFIHLGNGDLIFSGSGKINLNQMVFSIRSVSRPGAFAIHVKGIYENGNLAINTALSSQFIQVKKREPLRDNRFKV